jgi:hypothetical protein
MMLNRAMTQRIPESEIRDNLCNKNKMTINRRLLIYSLKNVNGNHKN